jgi:hypothetical protein
MGGKPLFHNRHSDFLILCLLLMIVKHYSFLSCCVFWYDQLSGEDDYGILHHPEMDRVMLQTTDPYKSDEII